MPRPPIQHHRLYLELPSEWEDVIDKIREIVAIEAVGRASAGFLSNPGNSVLLLVGVVAGLGVITGLPVVEDFISIIKDVQSMLAADNDPDRQAGADSLIRNMRALLKPFLGPFVP